MSAITGILQLSNEQVSFDYAKQLMEGLSRFPADESRSWHNNNIFLGCHAQWITPESVSEQLPFYDNEAQLAITADVILDNREELIESLQISKTFKNVITDSELILRSYQKWGEETPKHLIGDFAFMIWDERKHQLFGARDFSGSRTLYFNRSQNKFAFCSIIQPLLSLPYISLKLNELWLAEFLAIPGMIDAGNIHSTVYKNIEQLPPSHCITVSTRGIKLIRYCNIHQGDELKLKKNEDYEEAFKEVFNRAVTDRLRTRRNVGSLLSGGLDSGSVVSFAAPALKKKNKKLQTYSYIPIKNFVDWTPKNEIADERPFIKSTVEYVGNINDQYYSFENYSPYSEINDWLNIMEMPYKFHVNSFWIKGMFEVAEKNDVGILLNGHKGNWTISFGSSLDYQAKLLKQFRLIRLYRELHLYSKNIGVTKSRVFSVVRERAFPVPKREVPFESMLINSHFAKETDVYNKLKENGLDITASYNWNEYRTNHYKQLFSGSLTGTYATKLSLRHSLWERDPTNDLRVVKFCFSVPEGQYVQKGLDRALIRRSTRGYLPNNIRINQRTRGIQGADAINRMIPSWKAFIEESQSMMKDSITSNFFNEEVIQNAVSRLNKKPEPKDVYDFDFTMLMRALIVYRFIKKIF